MVHRFPPRRPTSLPQRHSISQAPHFHFPTKASPFPRHLHFISPPKASPPPIVVELFTTPSFATTFKKFNLYCRLHHKKRGSPTPASPNQSHPPPARTPARPDRAIHPGQPGHLRPTTPPPGRTHYPPGILMGIIPIISGYPYFRRLAVLDGPESIVELL